jgi:hypothetical protein
VAVETASLTPSEIGIVKQRLAEGAQQRYVLSNFSYQTYQICRSWELGTRAQALLESDSANYSVLTVGTAVPPSQNNPPSSLAEVFSIAKNVVQALGNITSSPALLIPQDGSPADPASIGVAVMLANWTGQQRNDGLNYAQAAENQFNYLLMNVSRTSDGAISHKSDQLQLWFV